MGLGPENLITINIQALGDDLKRYSCDSYLYLNVTGVGIKWLLQHGW